MRNAVVLACGLISSMSAVAGICVDAVGEFPAGRFAATREDRLRLIGPVKEGELLIRPTFGSMSVYFGCSEENPDIRIEYHKVGGEWKEAPVPPYFQETREYRGSIEGLEENTDYEVRIGGNTARVRTWASEVPVAKTVVLDPAKVKFPLVITDRGTEEGWIRYTAPVGTKLVNAVKTDNMIEVRGATHVLLDDMTLVGGPAEHVVNVTTSDCVRIRNCDISKWGRAGRQMFDSEGKFRICEKMPDGSFGRAINYDGAIVIGRGTSCAVVERCYVHDPNGRSVSWYYCHPAGPEAVYMCCPDHSTVLRWNDFIGSDVHRWNDAVEGQGNSHENGGFNRDADIEGNFMIFANDDCIELDGGQRNVRSRGNRYEGGLCGVSLQGCMVSPVYLTDDLFVDIADINDTHGQTIKISGFDRFNHGPVAILRDLTGFGRTSPPNGVRLSRLRYPRNFIQENCRYDGRLDDRMRFDHPRRPLPFTLEFGHIGGVKVVRGKVSPDTVRIRAVHDGRGEAVPFEVKINEAMDWFSVTPDSGVIPVGGEVSFVLAFDASRMRNRRFYRGAFSVRTTNGLSRVCSVYAETDFLVAARPDPNASYVELGKMDALSNAVREIPFDVSRDGTYHLAIHCRTDSRGKSRAKLKFPTVLASVDDDAFKPYAQYAKPYPTWSLVVPGRGQGNRTRPFDLKAGRHMLRLRLEDGGLLFDAIAVTQDIGAFNPLVGSGED